MSGRVSVGQRLFLGLSLIGLFGVIALIAMVSLQYGFTADELLHFSTLAYTRNELIGHVGLPILVLLVPTVLAARWVILRAFRPLEAAAHAIEAAPTERGVRIDDRDMPAEAMPFVAAINRLLDRLDSVAREQEAFAADVAHELRTPLSILSLELDRLEGKDAIALKEEVTAMRRLIDQLLLMAQVNVEAAAPLPAKSIDLATLAEDLVARLAPGIIAGGRDIAVEVEDGHVAVAGHREAIMAALRNLVENAVRASPAGGTVTVIAGPGARLRVRDEGPGLAQDDLMRLMQRHERDAFASTDGAGLGLAIAHRIMVAHRGHILAQQEARELILSFQQ